MGAVTGVAADKAAITNPFAGQQFFETDTGKSVKWSGSAWVDAINSTAAGGDFTGTYPSPTITNISNAPIINSSTSLSLRTGSTERISIDSSGRVTMPYQPSFWGWKNADGYTGIWNCNGVVHNTGGHYNTGTGLFTCPTSGMYLVQMTGLGWAPPGWGYLYISHNGVNQNPFTHWNNDGALGWSPVNITAIVSCAVNDTLGVNVVVTGGNAGVYSYNHNSMAIYKVG